MAVLSCPRSLLRCLTCRERGATLPDHHQRLLAGGSKKTISPDGGLPGQGRISDAVDDLSRMLVSVEGIKTDLYATEVLEESRESSTVPTGQL